MIVLSLALAAFASGLVLGCARGGPNAAMPEKLLDIQLQFAGPVNDAFYYFIALDADDDVNDGPIPVASGPYWGNGWGTGSMTHYVRYHQGTYEVFRVVLAPSLRRPGAGIVEVSGTPDTTDAGTYVIRVDSVSYGAISVAGAGMVTAATNVACQNAGQLTFSTNSAGQIVAGSVSFTPAPDGGRALTAAEQAQIDALNAGGVALDANTFAFMGIQLTVGPPAAGAQTLTISPATGNVTVTFTSDSPPVRVLTWNATLRANSSTPTANPPIPGLTIRTTDLVAGEDAEIGLLPARDGISLGLPYDYHIPAGSQWLKVTLNLTKLAPNARYMSLNFISTTELIFDPNATDADNVYDANGPRGNDYITIPLDEYTTWHNGDRWVAEGADDSTLEGPASDQDKQSVDLIDWYVTVRRL